MFVFIFCFTSVWKHEMISMYIYKFTHSRRIFTLLYINKRASHDTQRQRNTTTAGYENKSTHKNENVFFFRTYVCRLKHIWNGIFFALCLLWTHPPDEQSAHLHFGSDRAVALKNHSHLADAKISQGMQVVGTLNCVCVCVCV